MLNINVEHFLQAIEYQSTYRRVYAKAKLFNDMYASVDTSAKASVGLGLIARANFYMNAVAHSTTYVDVEGEYESDKEVKYQDKNQIWRKTTTSMTIDGENLNQEEFEYVGVSEGTDVDLVQMSKDHLN